MRLLQVWLLGTTLLVMSFLLVAAFGLAWAIGSAIASTVEACMVFVVVIWTLWNLSRKVGNR